MKFINQWPFNNFSDEKLECVNLYMKNTALKITRYIVAIATLDVNSTCIIVIATQNITAEPEVAETSPSWWKCIIY